MPFSVELDIVLAGVSVVRTWGQFGLTTPAVFVNLWKDLTTRTSCLLSLYIVLFMLFSLLVSTAVVAPAIIWILECKLNILGYQNCTLFFSLLEPG